MTSRSRRKHRITVRTRLVKRPIDRPRWREWLADATRSVWAGVFAATAVWSCTPLASADDFGRPPAAFQLAEEAVPIEQADSRRSPSPPSTNAQSTARWTDSQHSAQESPNAWKLRWRKPVTAASSARTADRPLTTVRAASWSQTDDRFESAVRQASQITPVDPFEEPYPRQVPTAQDSSSSGSSRSTLGSQPGTNPSSPSPAPALQPSTPPGQAPALGQPQIPGQPSTLGEEAVPFRNTQPSSPFPVPPTAQPDTAQPDAAQPQPTLPESAPFDLMPDTAPQPPSSNEALPTDPAPAPPRNGIGPDSLLAPVPDDMPCDRTYNSRNCCVDDAKCRQARQRFSQHKITSISLDITPLFTNAEVQSSPSYIPTEIRQEEELLKAPARVWKNRAGETVAEGRFVDYKHGFIHVRTDDGQIKRLLFNELSDDDLCFVTAWWSLPTECTLADAEFSERNWLASTLTWKASALCHKPLYFEEVALERYGHSVGPIKQPFVSGAHFFGSLIALPYQMGINPPNECQYALGYYRPGSCAPWLVPPFPVSVRGALAQAGVVVGGIYIIP